MSGPKEPTPSEGAPDLLDGDAFRQFYQTALPVVYGYFMVRCRSRDVALDLTQETFTSAVSSLRQGHHARDPVAWVMTIAQRRLVDHYRRESRRPSFMPVWDDTGGVLEDEDGGTSEMDVRLGAALRTLPSRQQIALILRYVDDLSVAAVAGHLEVTYQAAESLLARARRALAAAFEVEDQR